MPETVEQSTDQPSRQEAVVNGVNIAESVALTGSLVVKMINAAQERKRMSFGYEGDVDVRLINAVHRFPRKQTLHNLGVVHLPGFFQKFRDVLEPAIDQCDVLLVEDVEGKFFRQCIQYARQRKKPVFHVNAYRKKFAYACDYLPAATGVILGAEHVVSQRQKNKSERPLGTWTTRRNLLRLLAAAAIGLDILNGEYTNYKGEQEVDDRDQLKDRGCSTGQMLSIQRIMRTWKQPGARFLSITGNVHAEIIKQYIADPARLQKDIEAFSLHRTVFGGGSRRLK